MSSWFFICCLIAAISSYANSSSSYLVPWFCNCRLRVNLCIEKESDQFSRAKHWKPRISPLGPGYSGICLLIREPAENWQLGKGTWPRLRFVQRERWTLSYRSLRVTFQLIAQGGEVSWSNTSMQGRRCWWTRRQTNGHRKYRNFSIRLEITPTCDFCGSDGHSGIGPGYCHKWRCSSRADNNNNNNNDANIYTG